MPRPEPREQDLVWRLADPVVRGVFHLAFRLRYAGAEHVPRRGAALLAANHISVLDPVVIALLPSALGRTVRFLAGAEFFRRPVVGWALRVMHQIPIRRGASDEAAMQEVVAVIREGCLAGIFPEGRVGPGPDPGRGRRGAARIALAAGVPVVPVGVWGTHLRWPQGGPRLGRPLRPTLAVAFGEPLVTRGDVRSREDLRDTTEAIMSGIRGRVIEARQLAAGDGGSSGDRGQGALGR